MTDPLQDSFSPKKRKNYWVILPVLFLGILLLSRLAIGLEAQKLSGSEDLKGFREAFFAGGCFWCTESDFEKLSGVVSVISGYTGGDAKSPTYEQVTSGGTGHYEAVRVIYDPKKISYHDLVEHLWRHINPTDAGGQFVDRGDSYRSAIFYRNQEEKKIAEASKKSLEASGVFEEPIVTPIIKATAFYPAEDYHQDYYKKNPLRYKFYRFGSGRDKFLKNVWGNVIEKKEEKVMSDQKYQKPSEEEIENRLSPLQYKVTQKDGTERPFHNEYWDNKEEGIYVDIVSGEPLFSSKDKFKSGTGWPSFTQPLVKDHVVEKQDRSLFMVRTEVRSKHGDSHLGHVFDDGPEPTGLRYCINSASLRFVPAGDLEKEGYSEYLSLFAS